ncbi:MAG TPA: N-acetylglucosamine-6-phosphate deacetylase [Pirellula sp.]|nr:N-acetylglucosamine-6-phosphate deacetylase [Pirellula sp.]
MKYIDLQVNGAYGVDFNDDALTPEAFEFACGKLKDSGVIGFLATIITDSVATMCGRIEKIVRTLEAKPGLKQLVKGIHVEGPFLSDQSGFYGTHPSQHIRPANERDAMRLLEAGNGFVRLVTLAPEQDSDSKVIRKLCKENVLVFAGHTDAKFEILARAIDSGLVGFTHLGNGCIQQVDRHDNIIHRVLALRDRLYITLIADGVHLPGWLVKFWLEVIANDRSIIISDSMSAAGMPPGEYQIGNQNILVESSRRTRHREHGYLAGSASTMQDMDRFLSETLGICEAERQSCMLNNASSLLLKDS